MQASERPFHYSPLFRNLNAIDPKDFQRIIREYEYQEQQIGQLDPREHFELTVRYVDALFATGAHRRHLLMVDLVIFASIDRNIKYLHGQDVYERMLFRKAASAFHTRDYPACEHICRELVRMYPKASVHKKLLSRSLFQQQQQTLQFGRASLIFCCLLTAVIIVLDLLVIKNFYPAEHEAFTWLRNGVFFTGLGAICLAYALVFYRSRSAVKKYASTITKQ